LRFITDLSVPVDSNQAGRDLRLALAQAANVFGGFRSEDGAHAHAFATIRFYLPLRKQSVDPHQTLVMTFRGNPPMPCPA
jgi:hypothetical protein